MSVRFVSVPIFLVAFTAVDGMSQEQPDLLASHDVRRVALVMGAQNYQKLDHVPNAMNDAARVADVLRGLRFSFVRHVPDPTRSDLDGFLNELANEIGDDPAVVLIFFAGHGFHDATQNYLVPINASKDDLAASSIAVTSILGSIVSDRPGITILLLDACRAPAPTQRPEGTAAKKPIGAEGFAPVGNTDNAIVGFASQFGWPAGSVAFPGATNSPYTTGLLKYIVTKDASLDQVLEAVRREVRELTKGTQSPQILKGAASSAFAFQPSQTQRDQERDAWVRTLNSYDEGCVHRYIESYPDSPYLQSAVRWLENHPVRPVTGVSACPQQ